MDVSEKLPRKSTNYFFYHFMLLESAFN